MNNKDKKQESEEKKIIDIDFKAPNILNDVQNTNKKLLIGSIIFLVIGHMVNNKKLRNRMFQGLFIVFFIQLIDIYTFRDKATFLRHEKYFLALGTLNAEGLYEFFIRTKVENI